VVIDYKVILGAKIWDLIPRVAWGIIIEEMRD
jgi:hypothetical protein